MHNLRLRGEISGLSIHVLNSVFRKSIVPGYQGASRPSSILTSNNSCSIFQPFLFDKAKNNLRIYIFFSLIFKIWLKYKFFQAFFCKSDHAKTFHGSCEVPHKIWIWLVQFWRLLETNKQTNRKKKSIYIDSEHRLFL